MKKALLGTTALVAAGLAVGDAYAADTCVQLTIGGRYMGAAGALFGETSDFYREGNTRNYVFKQDVEVYFQGHTTLDNGLEVGARVELEGQTSSDQIDAVYAYFSGGFGQVRFGDTARGAQRHQLAALIGLVLLDHALRRMIFLRQLHGSVGERRDVQHPGDGDGVRQDRLPAAAQAGLRVEHARRAHKAPFRSRRETNAPRYQRNRGNTARFSLSQLKG